MSNDHAGRSTPRRRQYFFLFVGGCVLALVSALFDPNPLAFIAGMLLGGGTVAFDRETKHEPW